MLYKFNHNLYNRFEIFEQNKLGPRAYFIPFSTREALDATTYLNERSKSDAVTVLSGKWDFKLFNRISEMPREIDSYFFDFDSITVPGCWQFQGYEAPFYINSRYMFDCVPPNIPDDEGTYGLTAKVDKEGLSSHVKVFNSVGVYRKQFNLTHKQRHILTFLGVASALQLYCNGRYVGYSEGSHNTAEFDITPYVIDGPNEIICLVYKWCNGTYLECQDMFRNNGIFRDVYITNLDNSYIWDYNVKTYVVDETSRMLRIDIDAIMEKGVKPTYELYYGKKLIAKGEGETCCDFTIEKPYLWSAETPYLYKLVISLKKANQTLYCIRQEVGFKDIAIKKSVFYFNDKPIKIKGVNHHDTNPRTGYAMSVQDMQKDVELMKLMNVNAVRTSHYPPDPLFIKMANYEGLYIIDEADIETHGTYGKKFAQPNLISNNKRWFDHFWDRVYRMYMRDRNNPSITMWSLGNECGGWKNQDECYFKLKNLDPNIPIHYEGVSRNVRWCYDVVSEMYTSTEKMEKYAQRRLPGKYYRAPYFLCEYAHSMGVGPGSLDKYWEIINDTPTAMGGCIWEWADHAVLEKDGTYTYGGDHNEYAHDSNFCVDGLLLPNRYPSSSAYEMRCVYRPIKASYVSNNKYSLHNSNFFEDTSKIIFKWEYLQNGEILADGEFKVVIPPEGNYVATLKHPLLNTAKDCFMNFYYLDARTGVEMAREQLTLCLSVDRLPKLDSDSVACIEENGKYKIATNNGNVVFDKLTGKMVSYNIKDQELISTQTNAQIFYPVIYRPNVDNYMFINEEWKKIGLDKARVELRNFRCEKLKDKVQAVMEQRIYLKSKIRFIVTTTYNIYGNGCIDVNSILDIAKEYDLPKFGLTVELPFECRNVLYYGRGESENYADFKEHALIGIYKDRVETMHDLYLRPQDCGNRSEVRWAQLTDDEGNGIRFVADEKTFNFTAQPYRDDLVANSKHAKDLIDENKTVVKIDAFVRGIGSNSCGPDTRVEYRHTSVDSIEYMFRMVPVIKNQLIK